MSLFTKADFEVLRVVPCCKTGIDNEFQPYRRVYGKAENWLDITKARILTKKYGDDAEPFAQWLMKEILMRMYTTYLPDATQHQIIGFSVVYGPEKIRGERSYFVTEDYEENFDKIEMIFMQVEEAMVILVDKIYSDYLVTQLALKITE